MRIGIVGTGNLGGRLGRVWAAAGHEVIFGSRSADKAASLARSVDGRAEGGTLAQAFEWADVVVLAIPFSASGEVLQGRQGLTGKILVDCTNPRPGEIAKTPFSSAAEQIAFWAPEARVVKAFNTLGADVLSDLQFGADRASTFICGDDEEAKATVAQLGSDLGFDVVDAGPLTNAHLLESLAILWITLAYQQGMGPDIAFRLLRRNRAAAAGARGR